MWRKMVVISSLGISSLIGVGIVESQTSPQSFADLHFTPYLKKYLQKDPGKFGFSLLNNTGIFGRLLGTLKTIKEEDCVSKTLKGSSYYNFGLAKMFTPTIQKCGCMYGVKGQSVVMWSLLGTEWLTAGLEPQNLPTDKQSMVQLCA